MPPTVYWQDAGIYLTGIKVEGNVYPPGFPLYMILATIWTKIVPIGDFTTKVHGFSALFGAASASMCYLITHMVLKNKNTLFIKKTQLQEHKNTHYSGTEHKPVPIPFSQNSIVTGVVSFAVSMLVGLNYNIWGQAINAEVYTLHVFLLSCVVYLIIKIGIKGKIEKQIDSETRNKIIVTALILGFMFGNHPMTIVLAPLFMLLAIFQKNIFYHTKLLTLSALLFTAAALSTYIYLPVIANTNPDLNWGNPDTLARFIQHVSGKTYLTTEGSFVFTDLSRYYAALNEFAWEFGIAGLILALIGLYTAFKKDTYSAIITGTIVIFHIIFAVFYKQTTEYNSWLIPAHLMIAILIGYTIYNTIDGTHTLIEQKKPYYLYIPAILLIGYFSIFTINHWRENLNELNRREYYYAQDFGENILRKLDKNSLIIMTGDQESSTVLYLQAVREYRKDVIAFKNIEAEELTYSEGRDEIKKRYPTLILPRELENSDVEVADQYYNKLIAANIHNRSVYVMSKNLFILDSSQFQLIPAAAMYKVVPLNCIECIQKLDTKYWDLHYHDLEYYKKQERPLMSLKDSTKPGGINRVPFIQHMINFELQSWKNLGDWYIQKGECKLAAASYNNMVHLQRDIFTKLPQVKQNMQDCAK
ncbi:MAG: DUF2723 domain-containing protein [bacterium]|nr:DUF2723 domain-containing protein [bacterium]